ncbi:AEC family transporter [Oceanobacillus caeni]|uniref:AEC family transporter n=1 Tax=Oceanobacillus caeni TaxID=405946 RepID=UPI001C23F798|nr:AEC family transporter [Oceanobacillus caeni]MBU8789195.1 AEC family transporter [Oceanobacillus caeni]MED4474873.1 AEC family transporter [Oceanobacillus caeni]
MESLSAFMQEMLVLYGVAILGFIVRKIGVLNENANDVLTQLILYITLPALILYSLDISFSATLLKEFMWFIMMSAYILAISCFLAYWMRKSSQLPEKQKSVYEGLIIFGNQGFIGYAVSYILLGEQGVVYLTIFNICYLVLIWTYGIYLFSRSKESIDWKKIFLNPGILSTLTGLVIFLLPIRWPTVVSVGLESVGKMTIPLSMMLIGILIANVKNSTFILLMKNTYIWKSSLTRLIIIPLLLLPFAALPVPFQVFLIAVLVSGMPSAPTISLYSQRYGGDTYFASMGVLLTTALCIITIPLLYIIVYILGN